MYDVSCQEVEARARRLLSDALTALLSGIPDSSTVGTLPGAVVLLCSPGVVLTRACARLGVQMNA